MSGAIFSEWLREVYKKRPGGIFNRPSILILDDDAGYDPHLTRCVQSAQCICIPRKIEHLVKPIKLEIIDSFKSLVIEQVKKFVDRPSSGTATTPLAVSYHPTPLAVSHPTPLAISYPILLAVNYHPTPLQ